MVAVGRESPAAVVLRVLRRVLATDPHHARVARQQLGQQDDIVDLAERRPVRGRSTDAGYRVASGYEDGVMPPLPGDA